MFRERNPSVRRTAKRRAGYEPEPLKLDASGAPHLAFFEVTSGGPLDGLVVYVTKG